MDADSCSRCARFGGPTSTLVMADWVVTIDRDDPR
jgi:hypothetical protein